MNPCTFSMSVSAIANAIAKDLSDEEINLLASVFMQLGDTLTTIVAFRAICENNTSSNSNNQTNSSNGTDSNREDED